MNAAPATTPVAAERILSVNNIEVIYDHVILVLKGVSLHVPRGGIVALLGANGAGKTTTLKAISNLLACRARRSEQGLDPFRRHRDTPPIAERTRAPRLHSGHGGARMLRASHDRGEPVDRRVHAARRAGGDPARPRSRLFLFSAHRRSQEFARGLYLRRRAANVRARARADVEAEDDSAGRALDGAGAADCRGDLRDREAAQRARKAFRFCSPSKIPTWR